MNIAIAQSGGPTCAINSSLLGVYIEAKKNQQIDIVYGSINGIEGVINDNLISLNDVITTDEDVELIRQTPSTILNSCRYKLPEYEKESEVYHTIHNTFKKYNIGAFFYIGGNDSMDTVNKLSKFFHKIGSDIKVLGVPKTIDNDLMCTDHTPGFGSAAKYVATTMQEIVRDSSVYSVKSVTIVEIMGRDTGWLAASSCVLHANGEIAPHYIYLPEVKFSVKKFIKDIEQAFKKYRAVVVAVSEGIEIDESECPDTFQSGKTDNFGHKYLAGVGKTLEKIVTEQLKCKVRSIELNVMQRCSSHISSKRDIEESKKIGAYAVREALNGQSGRVMVFNRVSNCPYNIKIESVPAENIANKVKYFPPSWINEDKNDVLPSASDYFLPLIQGEQNIIMRNGMPVHFKLK